MAERRNVFDAYALLVLLTDEAASLAQELSAPLLTGAPEFAELERRGVVQVL